MTWNEYQHLILDKLDRHNCKLDEIEKRINNIDVKIGKMEVRQSLKASIFGAVSGMFTVIVMLVVNLIFKK